MIYKEKIKADCFMHEPLHILIAQNMEQEIRGLFNDVSVMRENPNREKNIEVMECIVAKHMDFNSLLFLLYVYDWQFPSDWQSLYPETATELDTMIDESTITIGDFLNALTDFKIASIRDVISAISNPQTRNTYLSKVSSLREEQKAKIAAVNHTHLPVGYFKNHTMMDFINEPKPSLLEPQHNKNGQIILHK
jgi:hypothetical protein